MIWLPIQPSAEGTIQGGPLSPLLSNVYLDDLDKELESRGLRFARYADDFQIYVKTHRSARRVFASVQRFLTRKLKLVVNQRKSRIAKADGVEFLGVHADHRGRGLGDTRYGKRDVLGQRSAWQYGHARPRPAGR